MHVIVLILAHSHASEGCGIGNAQKFRQLQQKIDWGK